MGDVTKPGQKDRLISGKTVSLRANMEAMAALDRSVWDGVKAFPQRGLEIGGILTGSSSTEGEIRLEAIRSLPAGPRNGPAFQPSPADLLFIKQSVQRARADGVSILGHFRSQTSGTPGPAGVDQTIADLLSLPKPLLVIIPASPAGIAPALVYRRMNGEWALLLSFSLVERAPAGSAAQRGSDLAMFSALAPQRPRWQKWALGGLAVGLGCGAFLGQTVWRTGTPAASVQLVRAGLNLEIHPEGTRLRVQWNPASAPVAEGSSGILTVQEGGRRLEIPLDRQQLGTGKTFYYPESGWVEIRLEVYRDSTHYTGEAVALATGLPTSLGATGKGAKQELPGSSAGQRSAAVTPGRPAFPATPIPPSSTIAWTPSAPTAPVVPGTQPARFPVAPLTPQPAVRYQTAVPVHKVSPQVPADLRSMVRESVSVQVKVTVDAAGKVVSAAPVGVLTDAQKLLAPQAVAAARQWLFEPARRNGEPVKSESLLKFDFERNAQ